MGETVMVSGAAQSELAVARDGGLWLLGQRKGDTLAPVFELMCQASQDPSGGVRVVYGAQPLLLLAGLTQAWRLSPTAQVWAVSELGAGVVDTLRQAMARGQQMLQGMRAAQAGLTIAREMPKVKP